MVYRKRVRPPGSVPVPPLAIMILTEKLSRLSPARRVLVEEIIDLLLPLEWFEEHKLPKPE